MHFPTYGRQTQFSTGDLVEDKKFNQVMRIFKFNRHVSAATSALLNLQLKSVVVFLKFSIFSETNV